MGLLDRVREPLPDVSVDAPFGGIETLSRLLDMLQHEPATAAAAGAGAAAGAWGIRRVMKWLAPLAVPLYARIRGHDLARHPKRARLLAAIRVGNAPTTRDLVLATSMNKGTVLHHLRALERGGLVKSRRVGRDRAWREAGSAPAAQPAAVDALHAPARRAIVETLAAIPGLTQAELAHRLCLTRATMHHHVATLARAGLVEVRREGTRTRCYVAAGTTATASGEAQRRFPWIDARQGGAAATPE